MAMRKAVEAFKDDQAQAGARGFLEDLFEDYYAQRFKVYKMNFIRGIVFGFGSVIGGTLMVGLLLWLLSFFNELPFIGHFVQSIQHSVETPRQQ
jgi:Domain of unknown function (DUF5665)